ncbi:hypothetical protein FPD38_06140 [Campylobacter volucris]|uniref:Uncharacterized protein n=1 Tax=Campylobacter volucris TaxID=1031542 RepID=A0A5C7DUJ9_9BACT|nr:hypothetical protein [Campylobacter volucris]TXE86231.1 hypothetical protein FPD38_06140 [Campylobacter volucris]
MLIDQINNIFNFNNDFSLKNLKDNLANKHDEYKKLQDSLQMLTSKNNLLKSKYNQIIKAIKYLKKDNNINFLYTLQNQIPKEEINIIFNDAKIAILNDDKLENFLIQNILQEFNIQTKFFKPYENLDENYTLILSKEFLKYDNYVQVDFQNFDVKNIINLAKEHFTYHYKETKNVLIFKSNSFENSLFLNLANQYCLNNESVEYISDFKEKLDEEFKIILLDFEVIKYDLLLIQSMLNNYKKNYPNSCVIIFCKDKNKEYKFVDYIVQDMNKNEWLAILKKHINLA